MLQAVSERVEEQPDAPRAVRRSALAHGLRMAIGLALLLATLSLIDRSLLLSRALEFEPRYLALGIAIALPQLGLCALRWQFTAQRLGVPLGYRAALREYALSIALNLFLPLGVLGDALRVARHEQRMRGERRAPDRTPLSAALHTVIVERSVGQLVVWLWALAALALWFERPFGLLGLALLAALVGSGLAVTWASRAWASRSPRAVSDRLSAALRRLLRDLAAALGSPRAALIQLALSTGILLSLVAQLYCALYAVSLSLPPRAALQIFPFMLLSMAVPFSFAGFGPREAATAALYHAAQLSHADGVAFALAYGVLSLLAALPGLLFFALSRQP
jgi:glycosyltransferase 2 family protein